MYGVPKVSVLPGQVGIGPYKGVTLDGGWGRERVEIGDRVVEDEAVFTELQKCNHCCILTRWL